MADSPTVCPFCNDSILIPEEFFGSEVECPTCHKQFLIPKITEEESVEDLNSNEVGTFDCPTCGKTNVLPKSFTGKFQCQGCQKEIEVINDDTISCPHCGKSISKKDTTCMFCQRAINEPPTPAPAPTEVQAEPQPENTPAAVSEIGLQISSTAPVTHGDEEDEEVLHIITKLKSINLIACFIILLISISTSTFWITQNTTVFSKKVYKWQYAAYHLAKRRSNCRACYSPVEHRNKQSVQEHIHTPCN